MKIDRLIVATAIVLAGHWSPARAGDLAIVGAKVYVAPDAAPIARATVLMRDGRIAAVGAADEVAVPSSARVLDGQGAVVVAGFWNSHVHMLELPLREAASRPAAELSRALEATFTRWGFTTVFDISSIPGNTFALRRRVDAGEVSGPTILTTDAPFFPKDGTPIYVQALFRQIHAPNMEVASVPQAQARARQQLSDGADGLKLFAGAIVLRDVLPMDKAIASAIVQAAHRAGKPAFAHPTNMEGLEISMASGVDVLAHTTPTAGPWSPAFAARLVAARMALTPTLSLFEEGLKQEGAPPEVVKRFLDTSQQQVAAFVKAGGELLFGTDVGYIDVTDTRREYELMAGAGLDWRQILASLTTHPAKRFGRDARKGRIAPGMDGDVVVLYGDPARDAAAFADVKYTVRAGKVIYEAPVRPVR
ncbi:amidohydrolase family protein [Piscinibacter sp.]|uniref:amidohydrolase family protein n=1 Tax=Piscinibacter sp. TaxID=1903157 RepID=UPI002C50E05C|nr:amidohydrolase family protein [Albitalea sp.]HUG21893.1 amidohydrolase family protein [Albitalea sp.]